MAYRCPANRKMRFLRGTLFISALWRRRLRNCRPANAFWAMAPRSSPRELSCRRIERATSWHDWPSARLSNGALRYVAGFGLAGRRCVECDCKAHGKFAPSLAIWNRKEPDDLRSGQGVRHGQESEET